MSEDHFSAERFDLECPDCGCRIVVDRQSGRVLLHEPAAKPAAGGKDFDQLLAGLDDAKDRAEQVFEQEVEAQKNRESILAAKFDAALERAKETSDDEAPTIRPFDLD